MGKHEEDKAPKGYKGVHRGKRERAVGRVPSNTDGHTQVIQTFRIAGSDLPPRGQGITREDR